ncbi:hypothetical protein [Gillisia sp. CAL575]|uniref:hypothetical protein n=1 Tax=Gillisia sp. CAL575 TaxID=985255 RepID=UPI0003A4627B|nr:hypothetical protein [Gillisia sp. CAL575]
MKISLYEFLALSDKEQYELAFNKGNYLDTLSKGSTRYVLYSLDLFFVEIEYNSLNNKIVNKRSFVSGELLDKYSNLDL